MDISCIFFKEFLYFKKLPNPVQTLSYSLKKNIYGFAGGSAQSGLTCLKLSLAPQSPNSPTFLYTGEIGLFKGVSFKRDLRVPKTNSVKRDGCRTTLYFQGRHPVSRQQLLYIFLREQYLLKKPNLLLKFKKLLPAFKLMVINQSTSFCQKLQTGQGSSQNLVLYQTLNDYFFSPSFYFNINKGSR